MTTKQPGTVVDLPQRRRHDPTAATTERRSSPAFAVQLPADLPINLPDFHLSSAGRARAARLAADAHKAQAERLERLLQVEKLHKADIRLAREEAYAKGRATGRAEGRFRDRLVGTLTGMALGGIVVATSMAAGFRAWH